MGCGDVLRKDVLLYCGTTVSKLYPIAVYL